MFLYDCEYFGTGEGGVEAQKGNYWHSQSSGHARLLPEAIRKQSVKKSTLPLAGKYSRYINISLGASSPVIGCLTSSGFRAAGVRFFL